MFVEVSGHWEFRLSGSSTGLGALSKKALSLPLNFADSVGFLQGVWGLVFWSQVNPKP